MFEHNQYIPNVGNARKATGMDFQESPFPGSQESYKKVNCSSSKVLIITDESQQNLCWFWGNVLSEKCEFSQIPLQQEPRHIKEVPFLFQKFGLNSWPIEIKLTFLTNGCKVTDIFFFSAVVLFNLILSKSYIYQLMHSRVSLKEY